MMRNNWKKVFLAGLSVCLLLAGCGGGGEKNAGPPTRQKINTPAVASFKIKDRDVNIYEYTGVDFKDRALWTESLAVTDDSIYFFGMATGKDKGKAQLNRVHYKDEKISDFQTLDPMAFWRNKLLVSGGDVYYYRPNGSYDPEARSNKANWNFYDGKAVQGTDLTGSMASIDGGKNVIYYNGKDMWATGTLDKGKITPGQDLVSTADVNQGDINIQKVWADQDGFYVAGSVKKDDGKYYMVVRQFDNQKGTLLRTFEGPLTDNSGDSAVTEHFVVFAEKTKGTKGSAFQVYDKKSGTLLGTGTDATVPTGEVMVPMKNDSVLIYSRVNRSEAKLYRMDL